MKWMVANTTHSLAVPEGGDVFTLRKIGDGRQILFARKRDAEMMLEAFEAQAPKMADGCWPQLYMKRPTDGGTDANQS